MSGREHEGVLPEHQRRKEGTRVFRGAHAAYR
jgi:hypothetical protein